MNEEEIDIKLGQALNAMLGMMDILDSRLRALEERGKKVSHIAPLVNREFPFDIREVM